MLSEVVRVDVSIGKHSALVGFGGKRLDETQAAFGADKDEHEGLRGIIAMPGAADVSETGGWVFIRCTAWPGRFSGTPESFPE
ncbi:hypothetical protein Sa4125_14200 [Aureimonas sp. SA4125]|nr:hypothetical protein Sa4125_14200 [Aureimonas sp. SA4125]